MPDYGSFDYPQNTSHLFVEDYQPFWEFWVPGVLLPVVGVLGLVGNTFSIYILSRYFLDIFRQIMMLLYNELFDVICLPTLGKIGRDLAQSQRIIVWQNVKCLSTELRTNHQKWIILF